MHLNVRILCEELYHDIISSSFSFVSHLADAHPSYPPSMCVKREPHEASFAPFTPSSVGDSALADILPHQSSLSVDASYPAHAHGHCYSQYTSQAFIAGTASSIRLHTQIKIKCTLFSSLILIVMNDFLMYLKCLKALKPVVQRARCCAYWSKMASPLINNGCAPPLPPCFSPSLTLCPSHRLTIGFLVLPS